MKTRGFFPDREDDRRFYLILAGSFAFYLGLTLLIYASPLSLKSPLPGSYEPPRKITLLLPASRPVQSPPSPPPAARTETRSKPVEITPKKREVPKRKPEPAAEELEKQRVAAEAARQAKEKERNREIAQSKFASLFGSGTAGLLPQKELKVLSSAQVSASSPGSEMPAGTRSEDLKVEAKNQDADRILQSLPSGDDTSSKGLFGEHQTRKFGSGGSEEAPLHSIRTPEDFEKSFKAYEGRLKSYYDKTIQVRPSLKGTLVVRVTIGPDGTVTRCERISSTLNDPGFESEILRMIREQFRFSRIAEGEEYHDRALIFRPEN